MNISTYESQIKALQEGGSGGGGGDSDFSMATVTVVNNKSEAVLISATVLIQDALSSEQNVFPGATADISVILYKGVSGEVTSSIDGTLVAATNVTGGVTSHGNGFYGITGDGTITFE